MEGGGRFRCQGSVLRPPSSVLHLCPILTPVKRLTLLVTMLAAGAVLLAQTLSPERLTRVDRVFQEQVDQERIAGAVALVLQDGKPVYEKAFGWADKEAGRKMTTDAIFRIASQSKAITSAVILSLME